MQTHWGGLEWVLVSGKVASLLCSIVYISNSIFFFYVVPQYSNYGYPVHILLYVTKVQLVQLPSRHVG